MRSVHVAVELPGTSPAAGYDQVKRFARYPALVPVVRDVTIHQISADEETSDWEVYFRNGILRWSESDRFDPDRLAISFTQTEGDFESFEGTWRISATENGCLVDFRAEFDFGIPSLAGILEPVAERVFKETIARVVLGLFGGDGTVVGDEALARAVALPPAEIQLAGAQAE
ncbi:SRPBCC family protein [Streptomyces durbertensis]|uniref:SRPBCC family protein n=1 Tax=Streptomyces durbertensis TaxID=2448886 RepID=A0ABR6EFC4_9ACTN|nr:SRPBCC family protein [Streptomyces durbertensis]MBB1244036.1 SRPBCC family protein [Streptomyces durbertensis]